MHLFLWPKRKIEDHGHAASTDCCSGVVKVLTAFWLQNYNRIMIQAESCGQGLLVHLLKCWDVAGWLLHPLVRMWLFWEGKTAMLKLSKRSYLLRESLLFFPKSWFLSRYFYFRCCCWSIGMGRSGFIKFSSIVYSSPFENKIVP